jgi:hypothetical protein
MTTELDFNRVTFGLPVEAFRVDAYITKDERLPVVTEYVLRVLRICETLTPATLRDFFGFSDAEALTVVEALTRQGLLTVSGDEVRLSAYANERFDSSSSEDYPRFTKVEPRRDSVTLDLLSFSPLLVPRFGLMTENSFRLDIPEEAIGSSIERARRTYTTRFHEVASLNDGLRDTALSVYAVEDVQSRRRGYIPVPVAFSLGDGNQVERRAARNFEDGAATELLHAFHEAISASIPSTLSLGNSRVTQFIESFELPWLDTFVSSKRFDVHAFAHLVVNDQLVTPKGVKPLFGNLYLERNQEMLVQRISASRGPRGAGAGTYGVSSSAAWLAPQHFLWGRGEAFHDSASKLRGALQSSGKRATESPPHTPSVQDDLHLFVATELDRERAVANQFAGLELGPVHAFRPTDFQDFTLGGRLELFLYPTGFAAALFHLSLPENPGLWAPVGFVSSLPEHCTAVHKLLVKIAGGQCYGGRLDRRGQNDGLPKNFESACGFLHFSDYRPRGGQDGPTGRAN